MKCYMLKHGCDGRWISPEKGWGRNINCYNRDSKCNIIPRKPKAKTITRKVFTHPDIAITTNPMFWGTFKKSKTYSLECMLTFKVKEKK